MDRETELARNTFLISLGRISTQFVSFLLLPLYTALLSTSEYGTVDLVMTVVQLLVPVASLMIDQGVFRLLLASDIEDNRKKAISSSFAILTLASAVTALAVLATGAVLHVGHRMYLTAILVTTSFLNLMLQIARGLRMTEEYSLGSFVCAASTIALNVLFLAGLKLGADGMLAASVMGNALACIFVFVRVDIGKYISPASVDRSVVMDEFRYSIPLVPNQLSLWVMSSSDRVIVSLFLGAAANGLLAISHKFPAIYMTLFNIFQLAWHETGVVHYLDEDRDAFFTRMVNSIITLYATLCIGVMMVLPLVFDTLVNPAFHESYSTVPIYLIASLFNVVVGLLGVVYVASKRTGEIAKTTFLSAIVNIGVCLALVRWLGLYAAAISTLAGYFVTLVYRVWDTRKYLSIKYDLRRISIIAVCVAASTVVYYIENRLVLFMLFPAFVAVGVMLNREMLEAGFSMVRSKVGRGGSND